MTWLLDSNSWIKLLKPRNPKIVDRVAQCRKEEIALCSVVKAELWHGAQKYQNVQQRLERLQEIFTKNTSLAFDDESAWLFARIKHQLELAGSVIGPNDLKIASICLVHQLTPVTSNVNEFSRVSGLVVEDWA